MSKSPHDKYNLLKKYFDLVPPDSLSKTGKAIQMFQQPASQAQVAVRSFYVLSSNLSINSYTFSLDSANLHILFLFVPFYIDLAEPKSSLSCRRRQPSCWSQPFQCNIKATCQSFWIWELEKVYGSWEKTPGGYLYSQHWWCWSWNQGPSIASQASRY